jgi:drug/metabolite transporter (DMT)-like permease
VTQVEAVPQAVNANLKGLLFVALSIFFYAATDALAKFLAPRLPVLELIFIRNVLTLGIVFILFWRARGNFRTERPIAHFVRALLATLAMLFFFMSFKVMPLANAIAVCSTAPLILVILTAAFGADKVDRYQWIAIAISFAAALGILRPSVDALSWQALLPLTGAMALAGFMFATRVLKSETQFSLLVYPPIVAIAATGLAMPVLWIPPEIGDWGYLLLFGVFGIGALYYRSMGYAIANPAAVAPMEYSNLLWAGFFGFVIFNDTPSMSLVIGAFVIVASNLFVGLRSRKRA